MSGRRRNLAAATLAFTTVALLGGSWWIAPLRAATHTVQISDFSFAPQTLTIEVGDTVTWVNADPVVHTATSTSAFPFDTGDLDEGQSASITFDTPGTYPYLCTPHPSMTGTIVVVEAAPVPAPSATVTPGALPDVAMGRPAQPDLRIAGLMLIAAAAAYSSARWRKAAIWPRVTRPDGQ